MSWQRIAEEMSARLEAAEREEANVEVADRAEAERARLRLIDRFAAATAPVAVSAGGQWLRGGVQETGADLVVLWGDGRQWLVPLAGIDAVSGLGAAAREPGTEAVVESRYGFRSALRALARDRSSVRLLTRGEPLIGGLVGVGADHVLLSRPPSAEPVAVPLNAIAAVELMGP